MTNKPRFGVMILDLLDQKLQLYYSTKHNITFYGEIYVVSKDGRKAGEPWSDFNVAPATFVDHRLPLTHKHCVDSPEPVLKSNEAEINGSLAGNS